jgi:hypothetical protein
MIGMGVLAAPVVVAGASALGVPAAIEGASTGLSETITAIGQDVHFGGSVVSAEIRQAVGSAMNAAKNFAGDAKAAVPGAASDAAKLVNNKAIPAAQAAYVSGTAFVVKNIDAISDFVTGIFDQSSAGPPGSYAGGMGKLVDMSTEAGQALKDSDP